MNIKNLFKKSFGKKVVLNFKKELTTEEEKDIFDEFTIKAFISKIKEMDDRFKSEDFRYITEKNPKKWFKIAVISLKNFSLGHKINQFVYFQIAIFALDKFIKLSSGKEKELMNSTSEVINELIKEWKNWKNLRPVQINL